MPYLSFLSAAGGDPKTGAIPAGNEQTPRPTIRKGKGKPQLKEDANEKL